MSFSFCVGFVTELNDSALGNTVTLPKELMK